MSADGQQQNCAGSFVLNEFDEQYPQVVCHAAGKRSFERSFQFVGLETGVKRILCQQAQGKLEVITNLWTSLGQVPGVSFESPCANPKSFPADEPSAPVSWPMASRNGLAY